MANLREMIKPALHPATPRKSSVCYPTMHYACQGKDWCSTIFLFTAVCVAWCCSPAQPPKPQSPAVEKQVAPTVEAPNDQPSAPHPLINTAPPISAQTAAQLVALAEARLAGLRPSVLTQLDERRNPSVGTDPDFSSGQKAFRKSDYKKAQEALLRVSSDHAMFPYALEMLAWIDFRNKDYPGAVAHYESYVGYDTGGLAQWRLCLFYLADYEHQHAKFWNALEGVIAPASGSAYRNAAQTLQNELRKLGIVRNK